VLRALSLCAPRVARATPLQLLCRSCLHSQLCCSGTRWPQCVRVAVCCSVLQCVAVCCSVLQCVGVCFSVLEYSQRYEVTSFTDPHGYWTRSPRGHWPARKTSCNSAGVEPVPYKSSNHSSKYNSKMYLVSESVVQIKQKRSTGAEIPHTRSFLGGFQPRSRNMGWLRLVDSLKLQVSFAEYRLFYRALLQKRPIILRVLLIVAT